MPDYLGSSKHFLGSSENILGEKPRRPSRFNVLEDENNQLFNHRDILYEDALKLCRFISGGYNYDEFNNFLSLSAFNRCRQDFPILNDLCQRVMQTPEVRRVNLKDL